MNDKWKHGGNVYEIRRQSKANAANLVDFSANINPAGLPEGLKEVLAEAMDDLIHYPDPDYVELKQEIAAFTKQREEYVQLGNGAIELLYMLVEYLKPQKACVVAPAFIEYERSLQRYGAAIDWITLKADAAFQLTLEVVKSHVQKDTDLLIVCNPNNPTGHLIPKNELLAINAHCQAMGCALLVDESFIDFVGPEASIAPLLGTHKQVYILRSMTKFFAIPGLRLGFLLSADQRLHKWCQDYRTPWMINHLANIAGITVLRDREYMLKTLEIIPRLRVQLCEALRNVKNTIVFDSKANYLFFQYNNKKIDLKKRLLEYGIMIRSCSNYRGLDERYYRVAVKTEAENKRLIKALKEIEESSI